MRMRFKSALILIFLLIVCCGFIGVGYSFYHEVNNDADVVIDGDITVNYLSGKTFKLNGNNEISFSVTNNDNNQKYYYIQLTDVYAKDVSYELTSSNDLEISNSLKSDIISNQIVINGNETVNYILKFKSDSNDEYSGTIQVGLKNDENDTFADLILTNNKVSDTPLSGIGTVALEDEGLLKTEDDLGVAYYFRGNVTNNNVLFAGLNWKIVKINGDGSVKLVLDGILDEITKYYDSVTLFDSSTIHEKLNNWFNIKLNNYSDYIAYYKFCNDQVLESDGVTYIAYNRIITNKIPTMVCLGSATNEKIGLLTADEVMFAGGANQENKNYYLYNENIKTVYYTMTSATFDGTYFPFAVNADGSITTGVSGALLRGVRPVINIIKNAKVTGNGTGDDPYQIIINEA